MRTADGLPRLSSKDMEAWLLATDQVRQVVDLATVPDHLTMQRTCTKVHMVDGEHLTHRLLAEQDVWTTRMWLLTALASRQDRPASMT
ncbi:hypothetical protein [Chloroflexus sp.]|uniref:hypothetical protein n=1 Tax=Chloroflexus sp. TaxID=1904827 RepID=UPI002ADE6CF7|nr:hypothetical protein [Chloroflexus sp.]